MSRVLVIAAHPDDEVLGCGGTIATHVKQGDTVSVLILAEGVTSRALKRDRDQDIGKLHDLELCAREANRILGVSSLILESLPDNRMDGMQRLDIIKLIEKYIAEYKPQLVYTHHFGDVNIDHRLIHEAVVTACRSTPDHCVRELLFFEIPSSTEWQTNNIYHFSPNWFVNISEVWDLKEKALIAYKSEMREWPHPRSIEAVESLAKWRGAIIGVPKAESFALGRKIV